MGRLFDAVSSLAGLCQKSRFEGDAAMTPGIRALQGRYQGTLSLSLIALQGAGFILDWEPMMKEILIGLEERRTRRDHFPQIS